MALKEAVSSKSSKPVEESFLQIVDHLKGSHILELLCMCLEASGSSLLSGSSNMVPAACESCKVIWYLIHAVEIISLKGQYIVFPLARSQRHSLCQPDARAEDQDLLPDAGCAKLIEMVVKSFLASKSVQVAIYYCFHNGLESALRAALQVSLFPKLVLCFHKMITT